MFCLFLVQKQKYLNLSSAYIQKICYPKYLYIHILVCLYFDSASKTLLFIFSSQLQCYANLAVTVSLTNIQLSFSNPLSPADAQCTTQDLQFHIYVTATQFYSFTANISDTVTLSDANKNQQSNQNFSTISQQYFDAKKPVQVSFSVNDSNGDPVETVLFFKTPDSVIVNGSLVPPAPKTNYNSIIIGASVGVVVLTLIIVLIVFGVKKGKKAGITEALEHAPEIAESYNQAIGALKRKLAAESTGDLIAKLQRQGMSKQNSQGTLKKNESKLRVQTAMINDVQIFGPDKIVKDVDEIEDIQPVVIGNPIWTKSKVF
ncbi:Hypothetical_protein [Hexamita inflata]|uniref:Hypothetical_protein n=1 Tax=Hexamita inflata TaxID=28002 RepID=A0AA86TLN7_9EUKA|nr:Hypothetical protein HINF_LOCUS7067 [Hexamita inflata]